MPRSNDQVEQVLQEYADLLSIVGDDPFKPRAYEKAARAVGGYADDLTTLDPQGVLAIPGVGKSIAAKVNEFLRSGSFEELDALRAQVPDGVRAMTAIPGFGPKKAMMAYRELGIDSVDGLVAAAEDGRLAAMKGFSRTTERNVVEAVRRLRASEGRVQVDEALEIAEDLLDRLRAIPGVRRAAYAGSLRRMAETIGDVDLLVASDPNCSVPPAWPRRRSPPTYPGCGGRPSSRRARANPLRPRVCSPHHPISSPHRSEKTRGNTTGMRTRERPYAREATGVRHIASCRRLVGHISDAGRSDPLALVDSRARHPSSAGWGQSPDDLTSLGSGSIPSVALSAVRGLFSLARQLLRGASDEERRRHRRPEDDRIVGVGSRSAPCATNSTPPLTASRDSVSRSIRLSSRSASQRRVATNTVLGPEQLLFQLGLSANRLVALIEPLTPRDWVRTGRVGDRLVTLGEIVNGVLRSAYHDLLHLLQTEPMVPTRQLRFAMVTEARSQRTATPSCRGTPRRERPVEMPRILTSTSAVSTTR